MISLISILFGMRLKGIKACLILTTLFLALPIYVFPQGMLSDSIWAPGGSGQYYCLFHPCNPLPGSSRPLLILADPAGRARYAVTRYKELAEKHNFILCCSYAVKNGPFEPNKDLLTCLVRSLRVNNRVCIDSIYMAGFSGGSRLSSAFSADNPDIQGVIACGAGFPPGFGKKALKIPRYTGIIGLFDMNFSEMARNRLNFLDTGSQDKLLIAEFDHSWPPQEVFELGLYYTGLTNEKFREEILSFEKNLVSDQIRRSYPIAAFINSLNMESVTEFIQMQNALINLQECRSYIEDEYQRLNEYIREINAIHTDIPALENNLLPLSHWENVRRDLDRGERMAESKSDSARFIRYKAFLTGNLYEIASARILYDKDYKAAGEYLKVWSVLMPESPFPPYMLARNYLRLDKKRKAKKELKRALKKDRENQLPDPSTDSFLKSLYDKP